MALPAVVLALLVPGGCTTDACRERVHRHRCADGIVAACIDRAAIRWNVNRWTMRRRAWCESRMNPHAYNATSGASGLFQFLPSTWQRTPYARRSVWSAKYSSLAAAWMQHAGHGNEWSCQ
jgi:hypothetical protein